jgi:hypothetical protein
MTKWDAVAIYGFLAMAFFVIGYLTSRIRRLEQRIQSLELRSGR